jgi:Concanavalin A-like lectin/glucanases superfamily
MKKAPLLLVFMIALLTAPQAGAAVGLAGSWPLDEGSGSVVHDFSGHGNNGTISGGAQWTPGFSGTALRFDGTTGRVRVPDGASLEPTTQVTVTAWLKASKPVGQFAYIVAKGAQRCDAASYGLYTGPNRGLSFYVSQEGGDTFTRSPDAGSRVWDGRWHFVVGTYDGRSVRLYVDGVQVGSGAQLAGNIDYDFPDNDLYLGHYAGCTGLDFGGAIDAPQVWSRSLSAAEVLTTYEALVAPPPSGGSPGSGSPAPGSPGSPGAPASGSNTGATPPSSPTQIISGPRAAGASASPRLSHVSLSGLALGKPRVGLRLVSGPRALPINSFAIALPRGLHFARSLKTVRAGVNAGRRGSYILALRHGTLSFTLRKPERSLSVAILHRAIVEDEALIQRIATVRRFNRTRGHVARHSLKLDLVVSLTDTARMVSPSTVAVAVR